MSAMNTVNPTRSELLARRAQIKLARQGRDLLKEKRTALWKELMKSVDEALRFSSSVEESVADARRALGLALASDGREAVQSAAFAAKRNIAIEVSPMNIAGVQVPTIERKRLVRADTQRGYSLAGTSSRIDAAATRFEEVLEQAIVLAAIELRLKRLAEEIRKTTTRVNALDQVLLPRLEAERAAIERVLDEREREDVFRLKRVKAKLRAET
jgi:V/A-type H+/Na+-transporting ATPase subunit D